MRRLIFSVVVVGMLADQSDRQITILEKLIALVTREKISWQIGEPPDLKTAEMARLAAEHLGSENELISSRAALGEAVASIRGIPAS